MEKVKVTREQAEVIEQVNKHLRSMKWTKLFDALKYGFEVEPEFKVGDWVVTKNWYIGEIEFINEVEGWANIGYQKDTLVRGICLAKTFKLDEIERRATPEEIAIEKERRWWKSHGREVWELKQGDVLLNNSRGHAVIVLKPDKFYEIDTENLEVQYRVVCFAENRLDVK